MKHLLILAVHLLATKLRLRVLERGGAAVRPNQRDSELVP
jgi:hypothetical protein